MHGATPKPLPVSKNAAAKTLIAILESLGYRIFLSGGASAYMHGTGRPVKDLDFRIQLPFSFKSAKGRLLILEINRLVPSFDRYAKLFRINDAASGRTIVGELLDVEVSISNTVLPLYEQLVSDGGDIPLHLISLDDNIFDKMVSLMFREKEEKQIVDVTDLVALLVLSDEASGGTRPPLYYVRHLFLRRGAAYAFSSKPADIERRRRAEGDIDTDGLRRILKDPELAMWAEFRNHLRDIAKRCRFDQLVFQKMFVRLVEAAEYAVKHPLPLSITLNKHTPCQEISGGSVKATRSRGGSWEV